MNIAELFLKLGVKGEDSAGKALKNVDHNLDKVKHKSIATKAAILGVVYGLERMMSKGTVMGSGLTKFANATGLATKKIQILQQAAREVAVGEDEITGALGSIQKAMTNMAMGGGAPQAMVDFSTVMNVTKDDLSDSFALFDKFQKYIQQVPAGVARVLGGSLGFSDELIGAARQGAFNQKAMLKAEREAVILSDTKLKKLQKIEGLYLTMGDGIKKAFAGLVADNGMAFAKPIKNAADAMILLIGSFSKFLLQTEALEKVAKVFTNVANIFDLMSGVLGFKEEEGEDGKKEQKPRTLSNMYGLLSSDDLNRQKQIDSNRSNLGKSQASRDRAAFLSKQEPKKMDMKAWEAKLSAPLSTAQYSDENRRKQQNNNSTITNNVTINESETPQATASEVNKQIQAQYRLTETGQGS